MNQNSNIRRIDELGRIVIPKDIRKKLHIKTNEPLEIYISDDLINIKKYSSLPDIIEYIKYLTDTGKRITDNEYIVTDCDHIIASSLTEYIDLPLNKVLQNLVYANEEIKNEYIKLNIDSSKELTCYTNIFPIIIDNDRQGLIIEFNVYKQLLNDFIVKIFKNLIEKELNNY